MEDKRLVTLASFASPFEVEVVKGRLAAEGIQSYIIDNHINYTFGPTYLQGYRLQVEQKDVVKALNIYKKTLPDQ